MLFAWPRKEQKSGRLSATRWWLRCLEKQMDNKDRRARIDFWENDGQYIQVTYTQEDGQRVIADFKRMGWRKPPSEILKKVVNALRMGPMAAIGRIQNSVK
jgi:hypothetical protein